MKVISLTGSVCTAIVYLCYSVYITISYSASSTTTPCACVIVACSFIGSVCIAVCTDCRASKEGEVNSHVHARLDL